MRGAFYRVGVAKNGVFLPPGGGGGEATQQSLQIDVVFGQVRYILTKILPTNVFWISPGGQGVGGLLKRPS